MLHLQVDKPEYALKSNVIRSSVCSFNGDDILLISTSSDKSAWKNKIDLIGQSYKWGENISFIRKYGCEQERANTGFNPDHWISVSIEEVDQAPEGSNQRIGEYYFGSSIWRDGYWINGKPDLHRKTEIDDSYSTAVDGNFETCELWIKETATLNIDSLGYIIIDNNLFIDGHLNIKDRASLLVINDQAQTIGNGMVKIEKKAHDIKAYDYIYWSSPAENVLLAEAFSDAALNSFYTFDTSSFIDLDQNGLDDDHRAWKKAAGIMIAGTGYTAMAPATFSYPDEFIATFYGSPHNGVIYKKIELQSSALNNSQDWNLIGNPYPSAIDAEKLLMEDNNKALVNPSLYFWTHNSSPSKDETGHYKYSSSDYAMYTLGTGGIMAQSGGKIPTKHIPSCQGFFIEAKAGGNLIFNNQMRTITGNHYFFKENTSKKNDYKIWLNLKNEFGAFSQILIGFIDGASPLYEPFYDGQRIKANKYINLYSLAGEHQLAIQGTSKFDKGMAVDIGFDNSIEEPVRLTFQIEKLGSSFTNQSIYLLDKRFNKLHDLSKNDYTFNIDEKGENNHRFQLVFQPQKINNDDHFIHQSPFSWYMNNKSLILYSKGDSVFEKIQIFDLNGREIRQLHCNDKQVVVNCHGMPKNQSTSLK